MDKLFLEGKGGEIARNRITFGSFDYSFCYRYKINIRKLYIINYNVFSSYN